MTERVALRGSRPSDEQFLRDLYADSHPEFQSLALPPQALSELLQLQRRAQQAQYQNRYPDAVDQVIEVEGAATGRCWTHIGPDEHRLLDLAVLRAYQRRGIGRAAVAVLCERAALAGLPLRLTVWQDNLAAKRLYQELGFQLGAEADGYQSMQWTSSAAAAAEGAR